jgi:hypothetical protein
MEKNKIMKKILLILLCLPMIGFGQIINDDKARVNPLTGSSFLFMMMEQ